MRKASALGTALGAAALVATGALTAPASAADGTTTVELAVLDGTLAIVTTALAPAASSSLVDGIRVVDAPLGLTTVEDTRAASTGWTLSAATAGFTEALTGATIPASAAKFYVSGTPTAVVGSPTFTTTTTADASGALVTAAASGINTVEVSPVLQVTVPSAAATGTYTGTVTQSVV
jgi:hypothetical protein